MTETNAEWLERLVNMPSHTPFNIPMLSIRKDDFDWLIEQAEQVNELKIQVASERAHKLTYRKVAERYRNEKNRYREALVFATEELTTILEVENLTKDK